MELRNRERNLASASGAAGAGASDVEKEAGKLASLPPAKITMPKDVKVVQISSGLHHTLLLTSLGDVYAFGSNVHGQLGQRDLVPRGSPARVALPVRASAVAAGGAHSAVLAESGEVFTFGCHTKGQLGRDAPAETLCQSVASAEEMAERELWYAVPGPVPNVGPRFGRKATWIGASGDQTFVKVDESLVNAKSLSKASVTANKRNIVVLPNYEVEESLDFQPLNFSSLVISRSDGFCRSFSSPEQEVFCGKVACMDPLYSVLWSYDGREHALKSYFPIMTDLNEKKAENEIMESATIFSPELALPTTSGCLVSRNQASLNLLSCLDALTQMPEVNLSSLEEDPTKAGLNKTYTKEDFNVVNRFDSHGGGWGYSGHSIEAVRFMCDTDVLLGGYGLFGGRGEYVGKIKLFDIGTDGGEQESDGDLLTESEDITYECGARQKYPILFDEPVPIQAGRWYVAWARVSGPSSDCGSSGQTQVTTEEQIQFSFKSSKKSNNGTDVNAGQVPQLLYRLVAAESQSVARRSDPPDPVCVLSPRFARAVTSDCFQALISLVQWSWSAFKAGVSEISAAAAAANSLDVDEDAEFGAEAVRLDLERLAFICRACMRLAVTYTLEVYPARIQTGQPPPVPETQKLAEAVGDMKALLQKILKDPLPARTVMAESPQLQSCQELASALLVDAHRTFVSCFHAFYPTGYLKWACLCNLLASMEDSSLSRPADADLNYDQLLAAVLDAMCSPMIKLRNTFPITYSPETETSRGKTLSPGENLSITTSMIQASDGSSQQRFPVLTELMNYQSHLEGVRFASWSFREVLDRLLNIVSLPVKQALKGEAVSVSRELEEKSCHVISAVISELANKSASNEGDLQSLGGKILHMTPNR